jgi:transposase
VPHYVGLDVSLKLTAICVVDRTGKIVREGVVASDPQLIAAFVKSHAPHVARVGLETGATSTWLWTELNKMGLPVICVDAQHARAALKMQINKSDRNDAVGIARIMQCGWYKEVRVKDLDSHAIKALLVSRALLVKIKRDIENPIRGLLKNLGLIIGRAKMNVFAVFNAPSPKPPPHGFSLKEGISPHGRNPCTFQGGQSDPDFQPHLGPQGACGISGVGR